MRTIPLTQDKEAYVDDEDWDKAMQHQWYAHRSHNTWYAVRTLYSPEYRTTLTLHRFLLEPPDDVIVDHKDKNGLNCVRSNMRFATAQQSTINRVIPQGINGSGYRGVLMRPSGRYQARIGVRQGTMTGLGTYDTPEEAARVYDKAARELHGEFAITNFEE